MAQGRPEAGVSGYGLIRGDAVRIPLADRSVDLIVTSPPYFALRSYQDDGEHYDGQIGSEPTPADFLAALWAVTDELWRVLKPTGSLWVNLGDKYAGSGGHNNAGISDKSTPRGNGHVGGVGRAGDQKIKATLRSAPDRYNQSTDVPAKSLMGLPWRYALGLTCPDTYRPGGGPQWTLRAEVIWSKPNGLPESVTDRVRRSHEQWFHVTKAGRYYAAVDEIREPQIVSVGGRDARMPRSSNSGTNHRALRNDRDQYNPLGKLPGSVWTIPSEPLRVPDHIGVDHFAAFPQELVRRIVLGWSPSGICTACGEGRVPVVEKGYAPRQATNNVDKTSRNGDNNFDMSAAPFGRAQLEATITGYACACPDTTAPTRPSVIFDPFVGTGTVPMVARALGRYGVGLDLSRDYLRLATWRITSGHARKSIARTDRERQGELW